MHSNNDTQASGDNFFRTSVLGVDFRVESSSSMFLSYSLEFMRGYSGKTSVASSPQVEIRVEKNLFSDTGLLRDPIEVGVHKSKHAHWAFSGEVLAEEPRTVRWQGRGTTVRRVSSSMWHVSVEPGSDPALVGESLFHLIRSIALYSRDTSAGPLVHASAVLDRRGRAVLFSGSVLAGKTTLLTESVIGHGAVPLTNDRAWIRFGSEADVLTWPSYASFCEGTLLNHPALAKAAEEFERDTNPYRTIRNEGPLLAGFDKDTKRIYPMSWFTDATKTAYASSAPLGSVVLTRLVPGMGRSELRELDLNADTDRANVVDLFERECFDQHEPSFLPWHGMPLPRSPWTAERIVTELAAGRVDVLALEADPANLGVLEALL